MRWSAFAIRRKRCAPTLSSTPGVSEYITLTVRRIDDGAGSQWLTRDVKRGDYIWLSDAQGDFTCDDKAEDKFLLLAGLWRYADYVDAPLAGKKSPAGRCAGDLQRAFAGRCDFCRGMA
jgi:NADH oxidoreductase Hcr